MPKIEAPVALTGWVKGGLGAPPFRGNRAEPQASGEVAANVREAGAECGTVEGDGHKVE